MKELMGGLWFAGLVIWALLGFGPGLILLALGALAGAGELAREQRAERQAESWRRKYPPYGY